MYRLSIQSGREKESGRAGPLPEEIRRALSKTFISLTSTDTLAGCCHSVTVKWGCTELSPSRSVSQEDCLLGSNPLPFCGREL